MRAWLVILTGCGDLPVSSPGQDVSWDDPWQPDDLGRKCDVMDQNCPPKQKCAMIPPDTPGEDYTPRCVELLDTRHDGHPCDLYSSGQDECGAGMWCFASTCRTFCAGSCSTVGLPDDTCVQLFATGESACFADCDPLAPDPCGFGEGCLLLGADTFACLPVYAHAPTPGAACSGGQDCAPGFACLSTGCEPYCDLGAADPVCPAETTCQSLSGAAPPVGICR